MGKMDKGLEIKDWTDRHRTSDEWWDRCTLGLGMENGTDGQRIRDGRWDRWTQA